MLAFSSSGIALPIAPASSHLRVSSFVRSALRPTRAPGISQKRSSNRAIVIAARRERIDPSDEAFATCTSCGSDEIVSASKLISQRSMTVKCSQCGANFKASVEEALTITGNKLVVPPGSGEDGDEAEDIMKKVGFKLYVSGLGPKVDSASLKSAFQEFGEVREATVVYDKVTRRSRGFGFVTVIGQSAASAAVDVLNGDNSRLGRRLTVREAHD